MAENGDMITFRCLAVAFPPPSYSWSTPNTSTDLNTSDIIFPAFFSSVGNYTCMVNSNGAMATSNTAVLTGKIIVHFGENYF